MPDVTVVIPTYNEAGNIGRIVPAILEANPDHNVDILVVDDDSKDGTGRIAEEAGARVIVRKNEKGLATAVIRGLRETQSGYVMVMDADFQHPPNMVGKMVDKAIAEDADVVVGSRYVDGGNDGSFTFVRKVMSRGARMLANIGIPDLRRHRVTDPMSGLFLIRASAVDLDALEPKGYKILLEIIGRCPVDKIVEVGYEFGIRDAGESKLGARVMGDYLLHLARLSAAHPENRRVGKFALVGISGIFVNLAALWALVETGVLGAGMYADDIASLIAIELSIISNFVLNDFITFKDRRHDHFLSRMAKFNVVALVGMGVQFGIAFIGREGIGIHYLVAQAIGIGAAFMVNYLLNLKWTYPGQRKQSQ
ncbi:MAG: glycosyltransferase [Thermoplasmatota archaeon]